MAIEAGRDDPDALWMAGHAISFLDGDHALGANAIDRALVLNPNLARAWMARGHVSCYRNQPSTAIEAFQRAMRLSPLDPLWYLFAAGFSLALIIGGRFEEAIEWANRSLRDLPRFESALLNRVVSSAHVGRIEEAREWLDSLYEVQSGLTITRYKIYRAMVFPPEILAVFVDGLRKVGMPEE